MERVMKAPDFLKRPRLLAALMIIVVAVIALVFWLYLRYDPASGQTCAVCHNMAPFYLDIKNTPHGGTACATCHEIDLPRWIIVQAFYNPTPAQIAARYSPQMFQQCTQCHSESTLANLYIHTAHGALIQKLSSCTICHNPHDPSSLSASCQTCHDYNKIMQSHLNFHNYAWSEVENGRLEVCLECHSPWSRWYAPIGADCQLGVGRGEPCISCHGPRAMPFSPAQFLDCVKCHGR